MKKIYLTFMIIASAVSSVFAQTVPTCSLNPTFLASNKIGVWPDSATNFLSGTVGVPYEQNITVKVPKDTIAGPLHFCFNRFVLSTPSGTVNYNLPPGLMIGSSTAAVSNGTVNGSPSFKFPGNANNCASVYGTPTTAGSYTLTFLVDAYGTPIFSGSCPASPVVSFGSQISSQTLKYYIINIAPNTATGLTDIGNGKMALSQNFPNPSSLTTDITFYVEGQDDATVLVYNLLGDVVSSQTIKTAVGDNKVTINTAGLAAGTYMYTLKYKGASATKRMIVLNH
jgi:hypothetical protein